MKNFLALGGASKIPPGYEPAAAHAPNITHHRCWENLYKQNCTGYRCCHGNNKLEFIKFQQNVALTSLTATLHKWRLQMSNTCFHSPATETRSGHSYDKYNARINNKKRRRWLIFQQTVSNFRQKRFCQKNSSCLESRFWC